MKLSRHLSWVVLSLLCWGWVANTSYGLGWNDLNDLNPLKKKEQKTRAQIEMAENYEWCGASEVAPVAVDAAGKKGEEAAKAEAEAREAALVEKNKRVVKCMIASLLQVAEAQSEFAEALGAKDQADKLRAESDALKSAHYTDEKALRKHVSVSKETNKIIRNKISKKQELTEEGRKQFVDGLLKYAVAIRETKEMTEAIGPYYDAAKVEAQRVRAIYNDTKDKKNILTAITDGFNYLKAILGKQFNTTKYLAKKGKGLMKDHKSTASSVMMYAKDNSIEVPAEVEAVMVDFV